MAIFSLILFFLPLISVNSQPYLPPKGHLIDCGATTSSTIEGREWVSDTQYISSGTPKTLTTLGLAPTLSTVRSFPLTSHPQKFCYVVPVVRRAKYTIRTTYYYGGVNGQHSSPPVFDQIVDGTIWGAVNTTQDYVKGFASYYEGVFLAKGKTLSVCLASNTYTDSDPFISALEVLLLGNSVYNSTNFDDYGLSLVARSVFGYQGPIIKYPDDSFDRYWAPFADSNPILQSIRNVSVSGFWNLPPSKIFDTGITTDTVGPMKLQWPPAFLPNSTYYISLYFADISVGKPRTFDITVNGIDYYRNLNASSTGVVVFATRWPLSGLTDITLTPAVGSEVGPVINAGEVFNILQLGNRTATRDVIALERVRNSLRNPPIDWYGDPCFPLRYEWTGVKCSGVRVITLNMSSMGLSGSVLDSIANLTALNDIWLGNNNLSGSIPDLSKLKSLKSLHLENNEFTGEIPPTLGTMDSLQELFIYNNNLTGEVPNNLLVKPGLNLKITPGNQLSFPSPSPAK